MNKPMFRKLRADEIECRVGTINEKGLSLLLYKDARCDMNLLDESGYKWKRSHELINGNLFCTVSIWDEELKEWVSRQDVGTESNTEATKGQASDSFKRACFNWGIGRELYSAPFIWVGKDKANVSSYKDLSGKTRYKCYDNFVVEKIRYDDNGEIDGLSIMNITTNTRVYTYVREK